MREPTRPDDRPDRRLGPFRTWLFGAAFVFSLGPTQVSATETLRFRVYLGQDPIGEHSFQISPGPSGEQVLSRASFDVDILFFNAYRYRHESRELWRDGCLERIRASTDDNGKSFKLEDGTWIGLESDTGRGRTLRYERI